MIVYAAFVVYNDPDMWLQTDFVGLSKTEDCARLLCSKHGEDFIRPRRQPPREPVTVVMSARPVEDRAYQSHGLEHGDYVIVPTTVAV